MHIHDIYMMGRCTDSHLVYRSSSKYLKQMTQGQPRSPKVRHESKDAGVLLVLVGAVY